jgi:hypothetical protein
MPLPAPVTNAVFPSRLNKFASVFIFKVVNACAHVQAVANFIMATLLI